MPHPLLSHASPPNFLTFFGLNPRLNGGLLKEERRLLVPPQVEGHDALEQVQPHQQRRLLPRPALHAVTG